jgi:phage gpG-like protein
MAAVGFKITRNDISPALSRLVATAKNPTPVFRAMGTTLLSITMGTFNSVGAGYRPKPWPAKKDGSPSNLILHGVLSKSFHLDATSTYAKVSNPMIYAAAHQFGYPKRNLPARPFFPVLENQLTPKAEEKIAAAAQRTILREAGQK